jgi:Uma2 family endonuclease
MVALAKLPVRMTVRDFLDWESGDGLRYELVDGAPRAIAPSGNVHGFLQSELARVIGTHLNAHRPGCQIIVNPGIVPHLMSTHNVRIPDLAVTCARLVPGHATLPDPVLVIEILSPSNQAQTWSNVWAYTNIPSVQEILVLHSGRIGAELLRRTADGSWPDEPEAIGDATLMLSSIGFQMPMTELYAATGLTA